MAEIEERLTSMLTAVGERADPAADRLRNPALAPQRRTTRFGAGRRSARWLMTAAAAAVATVAVGIVGVPKIGQNAPPAAPASRGTTDGVHPLWALRVVEEPSLTVAQLPAGGKVGVPVPHTVDSIVAPEIAEVPTLVTTAGTIRFDASKVRAVHLLAQRGPDSFIALEGRGHDDEDGMYDVRFEVVGPDDTRREIYHATSAGSVTVSPDGSTLALSTWPGAGGRSAVELVDVQSGTLAHRLPGRFTEVSWASDDAVVLSGQPGAATSLAWRAPWTGRGEQLAVAGGTAVSVAGGMIALDPARGCLLRLDAEATLVAANCDGWTATGNVSLDGRYVPLEWDGGDGTKHSGVLDVSRNVVRSWPVAGNNPQWLGAADVLLSDAATTDAPATAQCDLTTGTCVRAPADVYQGAWRGASWLGD